MTATPAKPLAPIIPPAKLDFAAGLLSYLIPGLGQIAQGRIAKGVVFFVSLYALFFYGWALGQGKNVYLPSGNARGGSIEQLLPDLYARPHFAGQVFIGVAAWPALWQYFHFDSNKVEGPGIGTMMRAPKDEEINRLQRDESKTWDLGWVYTVIAGVLNILVIYDAIAGPAFREIMVKDEELPKKTEPAVV
jgi:hypothetical protein